MKTPTTLYAAFIFSVCLIFSFDTLGQRMPHGGGGRSSVQNSSARPSVNGGAQRSTNRPPTTGYQPANTRPSAGTQPAAGNRQASNNVNAGGQRPAAGQQPAGGNNVNRGNNNNINSGNRNITINNDVTINRGGNRYYNGYHGYHPYYYHPYHPYHYGPAYYPVGAFIAVLAVTAVVVSIESQKYYYDQGVYYTETKGGYEATLPKEGTTVQTIPDEREKISLNDKDYYYYAGVFYSKSNTGYTVIKAPDGAMVTHLPEGAEEVQIGEEIYMYYYGTYFLPFTLNGQDMYQVVEMVPAPKAEEAAPAAK